MFTQSDSARVRAWPRRRFCCSPARCRRRTRRRGGSVPQRFHCKYPIQQTAALTARAAEL